VSPWYTAGTVPGGWVDAVTMDGARTAVTAAGAPLADGASRAVTLTEALPIPVDNAAHTLAVGPGRCWVRNVIDTHFGPSFRLMASHDVASNICQAYLTKALASFLS